MQRCHSQLLRPEIDVRAFIDQESGACKPILFNHGNFFGRYFSFMALPASVEKWCVAFAVQKVNFWHKLVIVLLT